MNSFYTIPNFTGDDGDHDAPVSQCESETCRQHYGEAQRVHLLSPATGDIVDTRWLCLKAQQVANQVYGVTLATDADEAEATQEPLPLHGDVRDWRLVTKPLEHGRRTQSHSEKYCARCGWMPVIGVWGGLKWATEHDNHKDALPLAA